MQRLTLPQRCDAQHPHACEIAHPASSTIHPPHVTAVKQWTRGGDRHHFDDTGESTTMPTTSHKSRNFIAALLALNAACATVPLWSHSTPLIVAASCATAALPLVALVLLLRSRHR
ncbi:MAG: hypothetical protein Q4B10_03890 [Actinomycetaceae bacterium]|nr:hypothetical protein [Actinomycetaceae bacterium]